MKIGDVVRHKADRDIGVILYVTEGIEELYEILWVRDGHIPLSCYGLNGANLEKINESG